MREKNESGSRFKVDQQVGVLMPDGSTRLAIIREIFPADPGVKIPRTGYMVAFISPGEAGSGSIPECSFRTECELVRLEEV